MSSKLLIATTNPAKLAEYRLLLSGYPLELLSLRDFGIAEEPQETGNTFRDNAMLKARFYFERSAIATLADDGGLEVDALGGAPGVASHRWLGPHADDTALARAVVERAAQMPQAPRTARLRCATALVYRKDSKIQEAITEGTMQGVIAARAYSPVRPGFPYRAVLYLPERGCYLAELSEADAAQVSQRRIAVQRAEPYLREICRSSNP